MRPFRLEFDQFGPHGDELLLEILLRAQAMISAEGIGGEITDEQGRKNVETENGQKGAATAMGDHGPQDCVKRVKGGLNSNFAVLFESGSAASPRRMLARCSVLLPASNAEVDNGPRHFYRRRRSCMSTPLGLAGGGTVLRCSLVCGSQPWRRRCPLGMHLSVYRGMPASGPRGQSGVLQSQSVLRALCGAGPETSRLMARAFRVRCFVRQIR